MTIRIERVGVALVPAGIGAVLLHTALHALGAGTVPSVAVTLLAAGAAVAWVYPRLPTRLDGVLRRRTSVAILWFALGVAAVGATARLSTFMSDEASVEDSIYPFDEFFVHHSCLSAHFQSARLQRSGVPNVYERTHYEGAQGEPKFIDAFVIDVFLYPPPMLLLSRLALGMSEHFAVWRAVWFGIEGAIVVVALLAIASWIGGREGRRAALLAPLVWLSIPTLLTLQIGNLHLVAISAGMLAMLAFERGRHAVGGAILAAVVAFKIFPAILIVLLLFQRRWRSLAWTAAFSLGLAVAGLLVLGPDPFRAFLDYQLPRLSSGAAFESLFVHPDVIAANQSVFGLVQKLSLLGVPGLSGSVPAAVSWGYSLVLIGLAALGARGARDRIRRAIVWLVLIQLASLRSPFTPDTYAAFPLLWTLVLLLARDGWRGRRSIALAGLIVLANLIVPTVPIVPMTTLLALTLAMQVLFFVLYAWALLSSWGTETAAEPASIVGPAIA